MNRIYKSDIHVHSKYSNKPTIWALKKINCPESYTSPEFIYKSAKKMGMDYVTITDHNTIQGVLEIAHLPGVFISTEVTTYFPEDGCKLHIVILDINEEIFKDVMGLRTNVYNLVAYLQKNTIAHFIAHPLYDNAKLSVETVEKILLLFDVCEVKNGSRARQFNRLITNILHSLTREKLESLANKAEKKQKIALFTDTLHEINGVAITIKRLIETAKNQGVELVVITSSSEKTAFENGVMNFKAVGDFALPEYAELKLHFPPILDVIDYFEKEGFTKIHASTPGTLGLIALFIAKLMDIPISGTYHTDIPQYVKKLTNDSFLENAAWSYMIWFYNQMGEVLVPSSSTRMQLEQRGLAAEKIKPLPRWVNTEVFSPSKRNPRLWEKYGLNGDMKFLYVGRVSKEKNLKLLADAFIDITSKGLCSNLIMVGDGPYRKELEDLLKGYPVLFTGFLTGNELSQIYASSDVFVFPSATDTFGNVVLEAQASGLPVIVSDEGGPKELAVDGETGLIVKANSISALADALTFFLRNKEKIATMGRNARHFTETNGTNPNEAYHAILNSFPGEEKHYATSENLILV